MAGSATADAGLPARRRSYDAGRLSRKYAYLRDIPESIYAKVVTSTHGRLESRVAGLLQWRVSLMKGHLPDRSTLEWPEAPFASKMLSDEVLMSLAPLCADNVELTESVLDSLLDAVAAGDLGLLDSVETQLAELRRIEEARRREAARVLKERAAQQDKAGEIPEQPEAPAVDLTSEELAELRKKAERLSEGAWIPSATSLLKKRWAKLLAMWREISEVFGELGSYTGLGRDLTLGVLNTSGWLAAKRLRKLVRQLPQVRDVVRSLGRLQLVEDADQSKAEIVYQPVRRVREELREVRTPLVPSEMRGIERSDSIVRMLPSEAALLQHPLLNLLWHARRAERSLLTYRVEGVMTELVEIVDPSEEGVPKPTTSDKLERGPIIFCLDTSGSMQGAPESVAKALVLEAVRVAHSELRSCYLYAFSGPGQVVEHELSLKSEGIEKLLGFLAMSFSGGTDVAMPLNRAADRLRKEAWNKADIVLVSDGEFPVPQETASSLREACAEHKARVHGVLIGASSSSAMEQLCDPLHQFSDWEAMTYVS